MIMKMRFLFRSLLCCMFLATAGSAFAADTYPSRPIKVIVAYPAGGANDIIARSISDELSKDLGQSVVVENKGGAGGTVGADAAAKAAPDGYTLFMAAGAHALAPSIQKNLTYDIIKDFQPISLAAIGTYMLTVHPSVKATSVKELIALAKANPGKLNFASSGVGAPPHLAGVLFQKMTGTQLTHIPYRGDTPAITDLLAGQVQLCFISPGPLLPHVQAGKLRALAMCSAKRSTVMPDLPTLDEAGLKGYALGTWWGLLAPAGTPKPIIDLLTKAMAKATSVPAVRERFGKLAFEAHGSNSPAEFATFIKEEVARYAEVAKAAGIEPK
jgi:tripartite-type tricarboxylate transporter receptor subunit TctC